MLVLCLYVSSIWSKRLECWYQKLITSLCFLHVNHVINTLGLVSKRSLRFHVCFLMDIHQMLPGLGYWSARGLDLRAVGI